MTRMSGTLSCRRDAPIVNIKGVLLTVPIGFIFQDKLIVKAKPCFCTDLDRSHLHKVKFFCNFTHYPEPIGTGISIREPLPSEIGGRPTRRVNKCSICQYRLFS